MDAWGKFPSAFLDGNLNDLGGFSECLNIKVNDNFYESKYCLGVILLESNKKLAERSLRYSDVHFTNNGMFPTISQPNNDNELIESRALTQ